jgi:hypothetical protein
MSQEQPTPPSPARRSTRARHPEQIVRRGLCPAPKAIALEAKVR